ncbi:MULTISPECIES: MbtH family NRPS accessory protein [unclassified Streptomyces]|uniref:MbtH family NRPS accessory protein n=1 Tax=unclassified Streptomyces TaxID=2593676 RepID=UPI001F5B836D|nr:MbtH family NRPS accessory protein [Streptomyces sp. HSG2]
MSANSGSGATAAVASDTVSGSPFEEGEGDWLVVTDGEGQHALWRPFLPSPAGWRTVFSGPDREGALDYVESHAARLGPAGAGR